MLRGKTALITGSATGIGKAIAVELSAQGANVVINYIGSSDAALHLADELGRGSSHAIAVEGDVSKAEDVRRLIRETVNTFGTIDLLVNNAGIEKRTPFLDIPLEDWNRIIEVDLTGPFLCAQAAAREMVKKGTRGVIINISSVHEEIPFPGNTAYCAAKGGLRMLCRNLALELAPHGIRIVNVGPGAIDTPINEKTLQDPEKKQKLKQQIPLNRIGTPEEVARVVAYLASDHASYVTGTTVFIDGGLMHQAGSL
jgi:glucose 1-dehydrogenase